MANNKLGFSYYNVDTDRYQDIRIKRLKKDKGCEGIAIYDYVLCEIYRVKGCYMEWDESTAFDAAEYFGLRESRVKDVVNYCCFLGLFNKELFVERSVLTSHSIQIRYIDMCRRAKRSTYFIPEKIKILEESNIIPEECGQNSGSLPQSKVKKSKEEESKGEGDSPAPNFPRIFEIFELNGLGREQANKFLSHYQSHDWKTKDGWPIKNWEAKATKWCIEEKEKSSAKKEKENGKTTRTDGATAESIATKCAGAVNAVFAGLEREVG